MSDRERDEWERWGEGRGGGGIGQSPFPLSPSLSLCLTVNASIEVAVWVLMSRTLCHQLSQKFASKLHYKHTHVREHFSGGGGKGLPLYIKKTYIIFFMYVG